MGRPIKAVEVLNKAIINDNQKYRFPIPMLCDEVTLKAKLNERDLYLEKLLQLDKTSPNELNEIAFLLNTERRIYGGGKNIIDHSSQEIKYQ
jgi:hypothetical protein